MIFILDTCAINNLLQVDLTCSDDDCELEYDYLNKINQKFDIKLPKKNYDELKSTFAKNFSDGKKISYIRNYINRYICRYFETVNDDDYHSSLTFIKKICPKYKDKDNGELHSTVYALYLNRYQKSLAFQTYFITDDDEAIQDFKAVFKSNYLGEIFTTIDLLLILSIYEIISHKNVMDFAHDLKKQYIQSYSELIYEIELLQKTDLTSQESSFLTKLYENIEKLNFDNIKTDIKHSLYKNIKKKKKSIDTLLNKLLSENLNKVKILDEKIKEIKSKYWTMDKI